ncbi:MAG: hypothetical protein J0I41_08795 [Filimonas sp.]|nr:hypothetical protein [Filimonas sp.]
MLLLICTKSYSQADTRAVLFDYFQNQQYATAIDFLNNKLNADSLNTYLLNSLGYAQYMNEDVLAAWKTFEKTYTLDTNNSTATSYLAAITFTRHDYEKAMYYNTRLTILSPTNAIAYRRIAEVYIIRKLLDSAFAFYQKAYTLASTNTGIVTGYADALLDNGLYERADAILYTTLRKDSGNIPVMKLVVRSALEQKKYDSTVRFADYYMAHADLDVATPLRFAAAYYNLNRFNACYDICNLLLNAGVTTETVFYYAALAQARLKNYALSNSLLDSCLSKAISAKAETYWLLKSDNEERVKKYMPAIANLDTAYYLFKKPVVLYSIGRMYELNGNTQAAKKYYKRYLVLAKPETPEELQVYKYVKKRQAEDAPITKGTN